MSATLLIDGRPGAHISAADRGLHYGDGLFETIACRDGRARWLALHLERLERGCARLGIAPPPAALREEIARLAAGQAACIVKLILTRGVARARGYRPCGDETPTRILARHPWTARPARGWNAGLSGVRLGENAHLAGLKHLNRLEQVLAQRERPEALDEVLMLAGQDEVVAGSMSNLFIVEGGQLVTPPIERCGVAGVMRQVVLETAARTGWHVRIEPVSLARLRAARAAFLTNARLGVQVLASFEGRALEPDPRIAALGASIDAQAG
ncbi:MAG: aminodeoxychorismate lyase [Gammaproteobacteria bacterium]|nr:aminodeoxychorismate lyase [Gammaproteobacteria bacterium]